MSRFALILCILLLLASEGRSRRRGPAPDVPAGWNSAALAIHRERGHASYQRSRFSQAAEHYRSGFQDALASGHRHAASRFLLNRANCLFRLNQYQAAVEDYLKAVELAGQEGRVERMAAWLNLSSLYLELGDVAAAEDSAKRGLALAAAANAPRYRPHMLAQLGRIRADREPAAAVRLLEDAYHGFRDSGEDSLAAATLDSLGGIYLNRLDRTQAAEAAYLEAFRLRRMLGLPDLMYSYSNLAEVGLRQGEYRGALRLADQGLALRETSATLKPLWSILHRRGTANLALGRNREALRDFGEALEYVRRWRAEVPASDAFRLSADVSVHSIYQAFVDAGNRLAIDTRDRELARGTFAAAEEHRAASLRARWKHPADWQSKLPPAYWETLAQVRSAEAASLTDSSRQALERLRALRLTLAELEVSAGRPPAGDGHGGADLSRRLQRRLDPSQALLSFKTGGERSWLWALSAGGFQMCQLPGRAEIARAAGAFRECVRTDSPETESRGQRLFHMLFGQLGPQFLGKPDWLLVLDDGVFDAPLAALVAAGPGRRPAYLAEHHSIRILPAAAALLDSPLQCERSGLFVGVADPVYNRADPRRWKRGVFAFPGLLRLQDPDPAPVELPRLAGSGREVEGCASSWERSVVLQGELATRENIQRALASNPEVLHLATHILRKPGHADEAYIALSLRPDGELDMLTPSAVAPLGAKGLVVLNGCGSGQGRAVEGAGLLGLTRAWLAGGARAVVATHWPVTDERGDLLRAFYRELRRPAAGRTQPAYAAALNRAQREMLAAGGWRSRPAYWARYFVVGKE